MKQAPQQQWARHANKEVRKKVGGIWQDIINLNGDVKMKDKNEELLDFSLLKLISPFHFFVFPPHGACSRISGT